MIFWWVGILFLAPVSIFRCATPRNLICDTSPWKYIFFSAQPGSGQQSALGWGRKSFGVKTLTYQLGWLYAGQVLAQ